LKIIYIYLIYFWIVKIKPFLLIYIFCLYIYIQKYGLIVHIIWHEGEKGMANVTALAFDNNGFLYYNHDNKFSCILKVNIINHIQYENNT